jgi:hypothetical protein
LFHILAGKTSLIAQNAMNGLLGAEHAESMMWTISQGVETNGVASAKFSGRGFSLVGQSKYEPL